MFKKIFLTGIVFLSLFFITFPVKAQDISDEHIQNFNEQITINKDGTINVQENILYDFNGLSRHGIYRDIPYIKTNSDGKKHTLDFEDFSVHDENGKSYRFSQIVDGENIQLKIGDPNRTITGVHTYIISYKVSGALTYFSDHDELYWNITGNSWTVPVAASTAKISLPEMADNSQIKAICYTGSQGSTEQNCAPGINANSAFFKANSVLYPGQGLTIVVSFPKGLVAVLEPKEYVAFSQTLLGKLLTILLVLAILFWYVVLPIYIPYRWWTAGRDPSASSGQALGEVRAWFDPPQDKTGRFLTPGETGTLVDEEADTRDVSAMIIGMAQKGYLKIVEKKKNDFQFVKVKDPDKNLTWFEKSFLTEIFSEGDEFSLKNSEMYETADQAKKDFYKQLVEAGSFPENPQTVRTLYYVLGGVALFTGNFLLAIIAFIFGRVMPRKTLFGAGQAAVARSLKNFLSSQERQLEFQAKNQMFFEKLLPYAVAFGVEKVWVNRFKDIDLRSPDWYQGYYGSNFTTAVFLSSLNSSFSKMNSAMTPTRSSSGYSSGFSGGFSGGGGGGGGGGSW